MVRDTRKDIDYFLDSILFYANQIDKFTANFETYPKKSEVYDIIATARFKKLLLGYCKGENITDLRNEYVAFVDTLFNYIAYPETQVDSTDGLFDTYIDALAIVSLAYLLKVDDITFNKVVKFLDTAGTDKLIDQLLRFKLKNRKLSAKLFFLKKYKPLSDFVANENKDADFLFNYTKDWYKGMRSALFYNSHADKEGTMYNGYWCWEAACLVCLLNIDDTAYRTLPVFPSDIVTYYKGE